MTLTVAIVGRPNVGKSTLFNRLTRSRQALVDDIPGLTRDRREGMAILGDIYFNLIDTAGLEDAETASLEQEMMEQTWYAVEEADIIMMVVDAREGITLTDEHFAALIRRHNKPTILVANKCEGKRLGLENHEAWSLGLGEVCGISAEHGLGTSDLYDALCLTAKNNELMLSNVNKKGNIPTDDDENSTIHIALAGRPNVGKSTLFNRIVGEKRSIVSDVAGTTRDAIYVDIDFEGKPIKLVDTAGVRKRAKRVEKLENLSIDDSFKAVNYANVVVLLLDATQALDKQDLTLADYTIKEGRAMIVAVNKWDLVEDKKATLANIQHKLDTSLHQAAGVPLITLSALEGQNIRPVLKKALAMFKIWNSRVSTGKLNRWLADATQRHIPPLSGGKRIKFRYVTQAKARPPTFLLFTSSNTKDLPKSYLRYLTNDLRKEFGFDGVPIRILIRKSDNPYSK